MIRNSTMEENYNENITMSIHSGLENFFPPLPQDHVVAVGEWCTV
jgi:hypothetical protein